MQSATRAGPITAETPVPSLAAVLAPAPKSVLLAKVTWVAMEPGGALAAAQRL